MRSHSEGLRLPHILGDTSHPIINSREEPGEGGAWDHVSRLGIHLLTACLPPCAEPRRCGLLPQHLADGEQGPAAAISVPVHGRSQALSLEPCPGQVLAVSVPGAPAELTLGWAGISPNLCSREHSCCPRACQTAVAVERVQILALLITGCVRWGKSLNLSEPRFP